MPDNITDLIGQITDPDIIKQILENATSKYHEISENDWDALA
jgi:Mg/Co/Ni transporter MgtE